MVCEPLNPKPFQGSCRLHGGTTCVPKFAEKEPLTWKPLCEVTACTFELILYKIGIWGRL